MKTHLFALMLAPASVVAEIIDFEAAEPGAAPPGWTINMTHEGGAPRWIIEEDPNAPAGQKVLAQVSDDPTSARRERARGQRRAL